MEKRQASAFYQHFDLEERPEVDYYTGLFNRFIFKQEPILTDFLNPRQAFILKEIVGNEFQLLHNGGYKNSEKERYLLCNWGDSFTWKDFKITPLAINYNKKWDKISHNQILGVLTNLGVELGAFGDIIKDEDENWQFFVKEDLSNFFIKEISRIGHTKVKIEKINPKQILNVMDDSKLYSNTAISLRLDTVIASLTNMSRSQVKGNIKQGNIKLNWHDAAESNIIVNVHDILSVRHFGRAELLNITSTRKGKYRIEFKIWQAKKR